MNNIPPGAFPQDCGMNHEVDFDNCPLCGYPLELATVHPIAGRIENIQYMRCTGPECKYQESIN